MAATTETPEDVKRTVAQDTATDEEKKYISAPKKNYKWWIAAATVAIIAGTAWYFYKN